MNMKKLISLIMVAAMTVQTGFASPKAEAEALMFDNEATNAIGAGVAVVGSDNARIVEDGENNKALYIPAKFMDSEATLKLPGKSRSGSFAVRFDIKYQNSTTGVNIFLSKGNSKTKILSINDKGRLYTHEGKFITGIGKGRYKSVTVSPDTNRGCYSVYVEGREVLSDWPAKDIEGQEFDAVVFAVTASNDNQSEVYIDNVAVGDDIKSITALPKPDYNSEVYEFTETDEMAKLTEIYVNENFEDSSSYSVTFHQKTNKAWVENGYAIAQKLDVNDDIIVQNILKNAAKKVVLEADLMYEDKPVDSFLFYMMDGQSQSSVIRITLASIGADGSISAAGRKVAKLSQNKWTKVSMMMDMRNHTYTLYIDGAKMAESSFVSNFNTLNEWRIYVPSTAQQGKLLIDNMKIYAGDEPRDIGNEALEAKSIFRDDAPEFLKGKRALQMYADNIWYNNQKQKADAGCITDGDDVLIPSDVISKLLDITVENTNDEIKIGESTVYNKGENTTYVNGEAAVLNLQPTVIDSVVYIPSMLVSKYPISSKYVFDDNHGMLIISDQELGLEETDPRFSESNRYMFFDRIKGDKLLEMYKKTWGDDLAVHPKLHANEDDFKRLKEEVKTDPYKKKWHEDVIALADAALSMEPLAYVIKDGRILYVAEDYAERATNLAYAWKMTGDTKYAEGLWKITETVCNFPDWHPDHTLDTASMAAGVAKAFDWGYDYFTEEQRKFIADKAMEYALKPARANYYGRANYSTVFWKETTTNWGVWVNGSIVALALATAEYNPEYNMDIIYNALRSSEYAWYEIAPSGAWYEGASYWGTIVYYTSMIMDSFERCFGEKYCGANFKAMEDLGLFGTYMSDTNGTINNFHDAYETKVAANTSYIARLFKNSTMQQSRIKMIENSGAGTAMDIIWADNSLLEGEQNIEHVKYYQGTEAVTMMGDISDPNTAWLSFHGGYTNGAHNHIDEGTFVYNIGGVRWFSDLGTEPLSYVANEDNPALLAGYTPYLFYRRKAEGHNSVVINPDQEVEMDMNAFAKVSKPVSTDNGAYATIDLSNHYAKNATSYIRGYKLSDGMRTFTLRDEIDLKKKDSELYWFLHTKGSIELIDNNTAIIYYMGKQMKVSVITNQENAELFVMDAKKLPTSPQFNETSNDAFSKLTIKMTASGHVDITAKMTLLGEEGSNTPAEDIPIHEWTAESESRTYEVSNARLSALNVEGNTIYGFNPENFNYMFKLNENNEVPAIEAISDYKTEISYFTDYKDRQNAVIKVYDTNGLYTSYVLTFTPFVQQIIGDYTRVSVSGAEASSIPEDYNRPEHSFDGNYNTRWSGQGTGEWIVHDFGEKKSFDAVGVALWKGAERVFNFNILISDDGVNYTTILSDVKTSGETEGLEIYKLPKTVSARYIKYLGYGNSVNEWNNVIELAALLKN